MQKSESICAHGIDNAVGEDQNGVSAVTVDMGEIGKGLCPAAD